jgi:hypothetical protein
MTLLEERPSTTDPGPEEPQKTEHAVAGSVAPVVLAALLAGAAGTHFAMAPSHADEWLAEGIAFAVTGWAQALLAVAVVLRPTRRVLVAGIVLNLAVLAAYVVSRTAGFPFGPQSGHSATVDFVDGLTAGLEVAFVALAALALFRPARQTWDWRPIPVAAGIAVLAVVGLTSGALASPSARDHARGGHGAAAGDNSGDEAAAMPADHHGAGAEDAAAHADTVNVGGVVDPEAIPEGAEPGTASGHGHTGVSEHHHIADRAVRAQLGAELTIARAAALSFPTAADAQAAGYTRATPYVPRIGAHWLKAGALGNGFDPGEPEMLLYDGNGLDAKIVGLSYLGLTNPQTPPEGFTGPNDPWHQHIGLCIGRGARVLGDVDTTEAECQERGGRKQDLDDLWMSHAWVVPGWESPWGTFSAEHPDLR